MDFLFWFLNIIILVSLLERAPSGSFLTGLILFFGFIHTLVLWDAYRGPSI